MMMFHYSDHHHFSCSSVKIQINISNTTTDASQLLDCTENSEGAEEKKRRFQFMIYPFVQLLP